MDAKEYYDKVASQWDAEYGSGNHSSFFAARLRSNIGNILDQSHGPDGLAVELGAGTGPYVDMLSSRYVEVLATDLSPKMVEGIRQRVQHQGLLNVQQQVLDAMDMNEITDGSVALVFFVGLLETIPNLELLFKEMARVLMPGGRIVGSTSNGSCPWYALRKRLRGGEEHCRTGRYLKKSDIAELARSVGLKLASTVYWGTCPPGLRNPVVGKLLDMAETVLAPTPLSIFMGAMSFELRKPHG